MSDQGGSWDSLPGDLTLLILEMRANIIINTKRLAQRLLTSVARGRRVRRILARARAVQPNRPLRNVPLSLQT